MQNKNDGKCVVFLKQHTFNKLLHSEFTDSEFSWKTKVLPWGWHGFTAFTGTGALYSLLFSSCSFFSSMCLHLLVLQCYLGRNDLMKRRPGFLKCWSRWQCSQATSETIHMFGCTSESPKKKKQKKKNSENSSQCVLFIGGKVHDFWSDFLL